MVTKQRIDVLIFEKGLAVSREKARAMIMAGEILVQNQLVQKPGAMVATTANITIKQKPRFVSRGGEKLSWALDRFKLDVSHRVCADVGASTGGFTDCLLQHGVDRIYAIDVGYGQIDYTLRNDERVVVIERTNARYLDQLDEQVNLVTVDASFISLKILLPTIQKWLQPDSDLILLIKPQFEAGRGEVGKGGVVRDPKIHKLVVHDILSFARNIGFEICGLTQSPIKGPAGNVEFLTWIRNSAIRQELLDITDLVNVLIP